MSFLPMSFLDDTVGSLDFTTLVLADRRAPFLPRQTCVVGTVPGGREIGPLGLLGRLFDVRILSEKGRTTFGRLHGPATSRDESKGLQVLSSIKSPTVTQKEHNYTVYMSLGVSNTSQTKIADPT